MNNVDCPLPQQIVTIALLQRIWDVDIAEEFNKLFQYTLIDTLVSGRIGMCVLWKMNQ